MSPGTEEFVGSSNAHVQEVVKAAEQDPNVFVYEPGVIIGSHDHACFEAQRCIGKRLYEHTVSMKTSGRRLGKDGDPHVVGY
jgi:hypothetical protein